MKERPILFSAPMIRALLDGRKTITRRVVNPDRLRVRLPRDVRSDLPDLVSGTTAPPGVYPAKIHAAGAVSIVAPDGKPLGVKPGEFHFVCPYADGDTHLGDYGDGRKRWTITPRDSRLWVREAFTTTIEPMGAKRGVIYRADAGACGPDCDLLWKPSIHMPRAFSRITLEVTGVRVERVQEISEADAEAEGVEPAFVTASEWCEAPGLPIRREGQKAFVDPHRLGYMRLWDAINGARPGCAWADNPLVWVIDFRRSDAVA